MSESAKVKPTTEQQMLQRAKKIRCIQWVVILSLFFFWQSAFSQSNTLISGTIVEESSKQPVTGASVRLLQTKDSALVKGAVSDKSGRFAVVPAMGDYILLVSFVGFKSIYRNVSVTQKNPHLKLGNIFLQEDRILLDAAVIKGKTPEIVVRGDTIEYNADSFNVSEHALVEELLRKIPGIEVSADGKIKVNGKEIKKIYVDGKDFFSEDPDMLMKNLPAKIIRKVQVYEHKSEREKMTGFKDGGENEKVLNLTVKEEMRKGWMGNLAVGYGNKSRYDAQAMINRMRGDDRYTFIGRANNIGSQMQMGMGSMYGGGMDGGLEKTVSGGLNINKSFSEKMDVAGYVSNDRNQQDFIEKSKVENIIAQGNTIRENESVSTNISRRTSGNARFHWKPDSLTSIVGYTSISGGNTTNSNASVYNTRQVNGDTIHRGNSSNANAGNNYSMMGNVSVNKKLNKQGRAITASVQASTTKGDFTGSNFSNIYYSKQQRTEVLDQRSVNTNGSSYFNGQFSYVEPLGKEKFVELSYGYNQNNSDSDKDARNKDEGGNYTILDKRYTRSFFTKSQRHNIGLSFRSSSEKMNYRLGIRINPSFTESKSFVKDSLLDARRQRVTEYASDADFSYSFSERERITLRYGGNTNHPSAQQLSSVPETTNPLYITYGNPNLKPTFNNNIGIDYNKYNSETQSVMLFSASFTNTLNEIATSSFIDNETGRQETTYENINGNWSAGVSAIVNFPLKNNKYSFSSNSNLGYAHTKNFVNKALNTGKNFSINQSVGLNYSSEKFDYATNASLWYNNATNTLEGQQNQEFMNWQLTGQMTWRFAKDFMLNTDIGYVGNKGYSAGFSQNEVLWNASLSKDFLKGKKGKLSLLFYDILQQKTNIFHNVTGASVEERTTNALTGFFILRFSYRFNVFTNKSSANNQPDYDY